MFRNQSAGSISSSFREYNRAKERILIPGKAARPVDMEWFCAAPRVPSRPGRVASPANQAEARIARKTHPVMRTNDARQSSQMESRVARASNCSQSRQPAEQENAGPAPPVSASHMEIGRPAAASALDSGLPTARTYLAIMIS